MLSSRKGLMIWLTLLLAFSVIVIALVSARRLLPENPERRLSVYDGTCPGIVIVNGNPFWCPGTRHPEDPHLYAGNRNGVWCADDGYVVDTNEGVRAVWSPGIQVTGVSNMKAGEEEGVFTVKQNCQKCHGIGKNDVRCPDCDGLGRCLPQRGKCKTCSRKGMLSEKCDACDGKGFLWVRATSEMSQLVVRNCKARCARQQDAALSTAAQNSLPRIVTYTIMTKEEREEARRIALEKQARDEENSRKITLLLQQQAQLDALRQQMMMNVIQNNMQLQQQMNQALMNQMMMNQSSFASPAIAPAPVNVPRMNTKRFCPRHGEWDTRGGTFSCPGCNGPKFGLSDPVGDLIDALK